MTHRIEILFILTIAISYNVICEGAAIVQDGAENMVDHFGSHPFNPKSPASYIRGEVDIFRLINVSAKDQGVSLVEGPIDGFPAYKFRLPYGNIPLHNSSAVTEAMSNGTGFTVVFLYRQQRNTLGTLISVNSPGRLTPWFQIASNTKTGIFTVKYRTGATDKLRQVEWSLPHSTSRRKGHPPLAAWIWMALSADFAEGTFRLDLDCAPSKFAGLIGQGKRPNEKKVATSITIPKDSLIYFRQEPGRKKKFLGSMQVAKVLPYVTQERLWSCMHITNHPQPEHRKPLL